MLNEKDAVVGRSVRTLRDFAGVPTGTLGLIVEDYGTGIMVAWDLSDRPIPDMMPSDIAAMYAVNPKCPLRDGFDKATEFDFLEAAESKHDFAAFRHKRNTRPQGFNELNTGPMSI